MKKAILAAGVGLVVLVTAMLGTAFLIGSGGVAAQAADCIGQPSPLSPSAGQGQVRMAHANIKVGLPATSFRDDLATVTGQAPDFVTLNEISYRSQADLEPTGYAAFRAAPTAPIGQTRSTAVLWNTSRWTQLDGGRTLLVESGPQQWDAGRSATWVTLQGIGDATEAGTVSVISTHMMVNPARTGPNPQRQQIYAAAMVRLRELVTVLSAQGPVFVAGDFNSQYGANDPWGPRAALGATAGKAGNAMPQGLAMNTTFDVLGAEPTHDGGGIIDFVFFQPAAATPTSQKTLSLNSDHRAVVVDLTLNGLVPAETSDADQGDPAPSSDSDLKPKPGSEKPGDRLTTAAGSPAETVARETTSDGGTGLPTVEGWSAEQVGNAAAIIAAGAELGVPARAQRIAVMTAIGESGLQVLDYGDGAGPDSRGLFQQRDNGVWGSLSDRMDPRISSLNFYKALLQVPSWETVAPTLAAHQTQRNADPYYYEPFWELAGVLTAALTGVTPASTAGAGTGVGECAPVVSITAGAVTYPIEQGLALSSDRHNWGGAGGNWSSWHTGTDFSVPCGTPVYAANAGIVEVDTSQGWAGPWLVKVSAGPGQLSTWYAHMQAIDVTAGQSVAAGQPIGQVGTLGNSTGCHLHFEVHTAGGSIYGADNVNPTTWLAENVGQLAGVG